MLRSHGRYFRYACLRRAQVPFRDGGFAKVDGLDDQLVESVMRRRKQRDGQESRELGDHRFQRKVASPDAQISMIGHGGCVSGLYRARAEVANRLVRFALRLLRIEGANS